MVQPPSIGVELQRRGNYCNVQTAFNPAPSLISYPNVIRLYTLGMNISACYGRSLDMPYLFQHLPCPPTKLLSATPTFGPFAYFTRSIYWLVDDGLCSQEIAFADMRSFRGEGTYLLAEGASSNL